mmetsp:Transcript_132858/g.384126  ORF Transcript_132858/g.384126 Transcript_132858/m.384126 type:complete len:210 (-) Transcript_132858:399-1028(-)
MRTELRALTTAPGSELAGGGARGRSPLGRGDHFAVRAHAAHFPGAHAVVAPIDDLHLLMPPVDLPDHEGARHLLRRGRHGGRGGCICNASDRKRRRRSHVASHGATPQQGHVGAFVDVDSRHGDMARPIARKGLILEVPLALSPDELHRPCGALRRGPREVRVAIDPRGAADVAEILELLQGEADRRRRLHQRIEALVVEEGRDPIVLR